MKHGLQADISTYLTRYHWLFWIWCVVSSFGAYACMYAFRKPFTAGTFLEAPFGAGFKTWLVLSQVLGYTISKFVGIKVIAEMQPHRRAMTLLCLIGISEVALLLFGLLPVPINILCLFLNGLPLGMVFGLVLGFLEGRRMTEAFVAGLCASFIFADGFSKSVGAFLINSGIAERWMPFCAGAIFILPLAGFVWMLQCLPPPSKEDIEARSERLPMNKAERRAMFRRYAPGLIAVTAAFLLITVLRSMRADFAPEIWTELGTTAAPAVFTQSETLVAVGVLIVNGLLVLVRNNRLAFFLGLTISLIGFGLIIASLIGQSAGWLDPFSFMVFVGVGLYLPYVAVHTTIFERLIAMTRDRANIGYLMYLADAFGYLGYVAVMVGKNILKVEGNVLSLFISTAWIVALASILSLLIAIAFFWTPQKAWVQAKSDVQPEPSSQ